MIVRGDGEKIEVRIGEDAGDPVFYITDLLPHLATEQMKRPLAVGDGFVLTGFKEAEWAEKLST